MTLPGKRTFRREDGQKIEKGLFSNLRIFLLDVAKDL